MKRIFGSERGVAMLAALGGIVLIGVIIAGVLFSVTQDYRISDNSLRQARATSTAELGLNRVVTEWNLAWNQKLTGDTVKRAFTASGGGIATVVVTKLNGPFFWAVSEGLSGANRSSFQARRRYGVLLRLDTPQMNFLGAITTQGANMTVNGNVTVNGNDAAPASWANCSPGANVPGAAISPTTTATVNGSVTINGNPPSLVTPAAADSNTYFNYGNTNYWSMANAATLVYPGGTLLNGINPVAAGGTCVVSVIPANWGEPNHVLPTPSPCESYFPVIHALGDLKVTGGRGQGILFVDGDLEVAGNFQFTGAVIVRGGLKMTGTGNKIVGATMAATVSVDDNVALSGNTSILYSSCALIAALSANVYPRAARQRGWVDVF